MARQFLLLAFLPVALLAEGPMVPAPLAPFSQLKLYFGLSDTQMDKIDGLNMGLQLYLGVKHMRVAQVEEELAIETAKPVLDPIALGVRYMELEAICREAKGMQADLVKNVQAILTPAQQPKWQALQDAFKLLPVIQEGQQANLLPGGYSSGAPPLLGVSSLLLGGNSTLPGCRLNQVSVLGVLSPVPLQDGQTPGAQ